MAASLFTLLDDIVLVLDDVAILTKVAAKKTAGVLGDDLALNAAQVSGVKPERELPVVWAVAKGSALNKVILVPVAVLISWLAPWGILPLLMGGGAYLCFEGVEKIAHKLTHSKEEDAAHHAELVARLADPSVDMVTAEKAKVKGAIRTDFILSAEIIVIAMDSAASAPIGTRIAALVGISALMTVGVYGLVAGIVKLDDAGLYLSGRAESASRALGRGIIYAAPWLMKLLSMAGTVAMFLVGGGILTHGVPGAEGLIAQFARSAAAVPGAGVVLDAVVPTLCDAVVGIVAGLLVLAVVTLGKRLVRRPTVGAMAGE